MDKERKRIFYTRDDQRRKVKKTIGSKGNVSNELYRANQGFLAFP